MEIIEIRLNKKPVLIGIAIGLLISIGMLYYLFFSGKVEVNTFMIGVYIFLTASFIYHTFISLKKISNNEPILTFTKESIEINDTLKRVTFLWVQINHWEIDYDEGNYYLILKTNGVQKKVSLNLLDKQPKEIEALMNQYKNLK